MILRSSFLKLIMAIGLLSVPFISFAKEINLLEEPKVDAKVVAKVDPAAGVIPIFTPKEGEWIKIADPKNGNVGWIKSSELNAAGAPSSTFTYTQRVITDNKASTPISYRIIHVGQPTFTAEQQQALAKRVQVQQQAMQKMLNEMNRMFHDEWQWMNHFFMPIIVMPVEQTSATSGQQAQPSAAVKTTSQSTSGKK